MKKRTFKQLNTDLDWAIATLTAVQAYLPELVRKREHEVSDGFPTTSMGGGSGSAGGPSDPTASEATRRKDRDPIALTIDTLFDGIGEVRDVARRLEGGMSRVRNVEDDSRGRQNSIEDCLACDRPVVGRRRAGYGEDCYRAWLDWRKDNPNGDRAAFREYRKAFLARKAERGTAA
jgi:hypothetical protein